MTEREVFVAALQIEDPTGRDKYLSRACADDTTLRRRVNGLLGALGRAGGFLEAPAAVPDDPDRTRAFRSETPSEIAGTVIGPYQLIELIGTGGMGAVWLAEQQEPVKRLVALKVVKAGMDSHQVLARFEAECQALALMDHPNIARVIDAGATPSGRSYFVMELVKGTPITNYCDDHRLTPRHRLELFVQVCHAVQHAHLKGVIHRDLKPSNVLVAPYDGEPVVKVIDFGVAKAVGQPLTERTLVTGLGAVVGTPQYMSPEQAELNNCDIDTRSDVYSLGVLLYELLTGSTPLTRQRAQEATLLEVLRLVREEDPPRPSSRLSTVEGLPSIAANRGLEPRRLGGLVRGELDWIVMRCLEKDRGRRYQTASALASDLQRYLADEPVEASPPSAAYRLRKLLRRNRGPALAASLVLLALVGGITGTAIGLVRAEQRAEGERRAKDTAEKRLAQVERGTEVLAAVIRDLDPTAEEKEGVTLRVLLGRRLGEAARQLEGEAVGDPLVVARLQHVLGTSLYELGHREQAEGVLVKACQTRERLLGADHLDTAATKHQLAMVCRERGKFALAEALCREVLAVRTPTLGADHPDTLTAQHHLAMVYASQGKDAPAEALYRQVLAARTAALGADHPDTLHSQHRLAMLYRSQIEVRPGGGAVPGGAGGPHRQAGGRPPRHPRHQGQPGRAVPFAGEVRPGGGAMQGGAGGPRRQARGRPPRHPHQPVPPGHLVPSSGELRPGRGAAQGGSGGSHRQAGGRPPLHPQLPARPGRGVPGPGQVRLGGGALQAGAGAQHRQAGGRPRQHPRHPVRPVQDVRVHEEARSIDSPARGEPPAEKSQVRPRRRHHAGDASRPRHRLRRRRTVRRRHPAARRSPPEGPRNPSLAHVAMHVVKPLLTAYVGAGKTAEAVALATEQVRAAHEQFPAGSPQLAAVLAETGKALLDAKAYAAAEPLLVQAFEGMSKAAQGRSIDQSLTEVLEQLVRLYEDWGKGEQAARWRKELEARPKK